MLPYLEMFLIIRFSFCFRVPVHGCNSAQLDKVLANHARVRPGLDKSRNGSRARVSNSRMMGTLQKTKDNPREPMGDPTRKQGGGQ